MPGYSKWPSLLSEPQEHAGRIPALPFSSSSHATGHRELFLGQKFPRPSCLLHLYSKVRLHVATDRRHVAQCTVYLVTSIEGENQFIEGKLNARVSCKASSELNDELEVERRAPSQSRLARNRNVTLQHRQHSCLSLIWIKHMQPRHNKRAQAREYDEDD